MRGAPRSYSVIAAISSGVLPPRRSGREVDTDIARAAIPVLRP